MNLNQLLERSSILILFTWSVIPFALSAVAAQAHPDRPNFLVILTDDQGYGDVSTYQQTDVQTPRIDGLAAQGMLFTNMRSNCTVCSPARAAILTGRYPDRVGVPGVIRTDPGNSWGYLDPHIPTLAEELSSAGYHTAIVGKWHLGLESPNTPNERGFDFFHGFLGDMMDSYTTHLRHGINYMRRNDQMIDPQGHATELFSEWAADYLRDRAQNPDQPFFLYLAFNAPHFPIEPPAEWLTRVQKRLPDLPPARAKNVAFVEHLDHHIGKVLDTLQQTGLQQKTLIIFTSDNGGALRFSQSNAPWRGGKQSHYDGGLRVPFIASWPDVIPAGSTSEYVGQTFDIFPTLLELAGRKLPSDLDARSLWPVLQGNETLSSRDLYFVRREGGIRYGGKSYQAFISGHWKLMQNDPYSPLELYNLKSDPQETTNLAASNPQQVKTLSRMMQQHIQRAGAIPWQKPDRTLHRSSSRD